jgi:hypothetical protein
LVLFDVLSLAPDPDPGITPVGRAARRANYGIGYELYRAQMQNGRVEDALLTARHFSERPNSPAYFHFLEAQCWAEKQNWERAWNACLAFQAAQARATK